MALGDWKLHKNYIFCVCFYCKLLHLCAITLKNTTYMLWYINSRMYQPHPLDHSVLKCFSHRFWCNLCHWPPYISTRSFQIRNQLYCTAKKCFYTITTYDVKFQSSITIPGAILCSNSFFSLFALRCRLACHHAGRISSSGRRMIRNVQDRRKTILTKKYSPLLLLLKICFMLVTLYASNEKCNKTYVST